MLECRIFGIDPLVRSNFGRKDIFTREIPKLQEKVEGFLYSFSFSKILTCLLKPLIFRTRGTYEIKGLRKQNLNVLAFISVRT